MSVPLAEFEAQERATADAAAVLAKSSSLLLSSLELSDEKVYEP